MDLTGYVYDNATGNGLPGASVVVTDADGKPYTEGIAADETGYFSLSSNFLNEGAFILVSSIGYQSVLISPNMAGYTGDIGLERVADDLFEVVVKHLQRNPLWLLLIPLVLLVIVQGQRKKSLSGVDLTKNEWLDLALKIGIPIAAYFVVVVPLLKKLGLLPNEQDKAQSKSDEAAKASQSALGEFSTNDNHTYTQSQLDSIAVELRNDTTSWMGYQWADLAKQFSYLSALTVADARYLLGTFVKKNGYTLYKWFYEEFEDAMIFTPFGVNKIYWQPGWLGSGQPVDYRANYKRIGVTEENADFLSWRDVAYKWITYVYELAGVSKQ